MKTSAQIDRFAVIGHPVMHSLSPRIHQSFALQTGRQLVYEKIDCKPALFEVRVHDFFKQGGKGLNVTLPFKQRAFVMALKKTLRCQQAANTLFLQAGILKADNTDGFGLCRDLSHYLNLKGACILVIGAGGAACGILQALLREAPAELCLTNRTLAKAYALQASFPAVKVLEDVERHFDVVINATSSSLQGLPIQLPFMTSKPFCYDLAYSLSGATAFVEQALQHGCQAVDGLGMLVEQAAESFYVWYGVKPDAAAVLSSLKQSKML